MCIDGILLLSIKHTWQTCLPFCVPARLLKLAPEAWLQVAAAPRASQNMMRHRMLCWAVAILSSVCLCAWAAVSAANQPGDVPGGLHMALLTAHCVAVTYRWFRRLTCAGEKAIMQGHTQRQPLSKLSVRATVVQCACRPFDKCCAYGVQTQVPPVQSSTTLHTPSTPPR